MKQWLLILLLLLPSSAALAEQRIVALAPHITEMLYAIGAGDRLVGVSDYSDYPPEAAGLPSVANYASINIEAVLALQPDLVIAWRSGNPQADIKRLQQLGINVAFSDPLTLDDIAADLITLGELTGLQAAAQQQADELTQHLQQLRQQYQHKPSVPVFFAMSTSPLSTVANNAWPQQILALCRAENPFASVKGDYPQVGIEQVLLTQPEVIIQSAAQGRSADFRFWKAFQTLPAVKKQQFLTVNADYLFRTTPRTLQGIQQLCQGVDKYR